LTAISLKVSTVISQPSQTFSTADVDVSDSSVYWRDVVSETHSGLLFHPASDDDFAFEGSIRRRWVGDIAVMDCTMGRCSAGQGRREIAGQRDDFLELVIPRRGVKHVSGAVDVAIDGSTLMLASLAQPFELTVPDHIEERTVVFPRSLLADTEAGSWNGSAVTIPRESPSARMLEGFLRVLDDIRGPLSPAESASGSDAILRLVASAANCGPHLVDPPNLALRSVIEQWIDRGIDTAENLSAEVAAQAHHISLRTLHRAFATGGRSYGDTVRTRRLTRAEKHLLNGTLTVQAIAYRCGFADASHFCRAFKTAFGCTPAQYRNERLNGSAVAS
jgi:AraC-like DNA-binding protein